MGCDIHLYVEHREAGEWRAVEPVGQPDYWGRQWQVSRDYAAFGLLSGVRNYCEVTPIAEPRGIPEDISWTILRETLLGVLSNEAYAIREGLGEDTDGFCTLTQAKRWGDWFNGTREWIVHPDYHSHSWLTLSELHTVDWAEEAPEFAKLVARLAELGAPDDVRIVFWFDN